MEFTIAQIEWMSREVHRQGDPAPYVTGMARAVEYASRGGLDIGDIHMINHYVTLEKTRYGYRQTPVTFRNGGGSINAASVPDAMERWWRMRPIGLSVTDENAEEVYDEWIKHFLYIHPYQDGNGRTASILRNSFLNMLNSPQDLPDYEW